MEDRRVISNECAKTANGFKNPASGIERTTRIYPVAYAAENHG